VIFDFKTHPMNCVHSVDIPRADVIEIEEHP